MRSYWVTHGGGGGGVLGSGFAGYVPLASQSPHPIIVYSVANYRPHLSHFWANVKSDFKNRIQCKPTVNPRSLLEKIVTRSLEGGGVNRTPPPSTFDTIHPIDLKFGTYNKLHLYFQLSETTWCLIGFHGNNSQINDVTGGRHLGFSNFQILFKFSLLYLRLTGKQHLAVEIHEIGRIHCEVVSI